MHSFSSLAEAKAFITGVTDHPMNDRSIPITDGITLNISSLDLDGGRFTNTYDLSFRSPGVIPQALALDGLHTVTDYLRKHRDMKTATSGGFFFLADYASGSPRQLALNLMISGSKIQSLPVRDQETVVSTDSGLSVARLLSLGTLSIDGHELDWSGSMTGHDTTVKIYGNGNSVITHRPDMVTDSARVLDETSRYTPPITNDDTVDIGFIGRTDGKFVGVEMCREGEVDIFAYDFVARCPERSDTETPIAEIHTIDTMTMSEHIRGAFSAGPAFNTQDFDLHPINSDTSLGSKAPFINRLLARTILYQDDSGVTHIRLFDGRPDSSTFTGVTPREVVKSVLDEGKPEWGCFLDPGQTAKIATSFKGHVRGFGNRHYLQWPTMGNPNFIWTPNQGRPVASIIAM